MTDNGNETSKQIIRYDNSNQFNDGNLKATVVILSGQESGIKKKQ